MAKWAIITTLGVMGAYTKAGTFSPYIDEAWLFDSAEEANAVAMTIKTPTVVQEVKLPTDENATRDFPVPDFFECNDNELMSVDELIWFIRQDNLKEHFTPVDKITGANQMTGGALYHPVDQTIMARELQFSFARLLTDNDAVTLGEAIRATGAWDSHSYQRKRLGFTSYAILTLRAKNR